jgi:hypothetical protein
MPTLYQSVLTNLTRRENQDSIHALHNDTLQNLNSTNNKSILPNLPSGNKTIFGFYEQNGQFCYSHQPDFDNNLLNVN